MEARLIPISICEVTKQYNVEIHINMFLQVSDVVYIYTENVISDFLNYFFLIWGSTTLLTFLWHLSLPSAVLSIVCDFVLQFVPSSPIRIPSSRLHQIKQVSTDSSK